MCAGELLVCPPFGLVGLSTFFENLILSAARSKLKIISLATREPFFCPHFGSIFDPKCGQTNGFLGGQTNSFQMALRFPMFGTIWAIFLQNQNLSWKAGGHIGGQTNNFHEFECYIF